MRRLCNNELRRFVGRFITKAVTAVEVINLYLNTLYSELHSLFLILVSYENTHVDSLPIREYVNYNGMLFN